MPGNTKYIMAIDQGTTSSRAIVFSAGGEIVAVAQQEFPQIYPEDGWVEHDPEAIWSSTLDVSRQALRKAESWGGQVVAIGITNQRETTVVWDKASGQPIYNAIVWQDRRTAQQCRQLKHHYSENDLQAKTGLLLDPYFSATKIAWMLDHVHGARNKANNGELAFGTIDSWLIWKLSGGKVHATDATNASRTNLFNIHTQDWDQELLRLFAVPESVLPVVKDCAADYAQTDPVLFGREIPVLGVAGDQQAAAIGQCCFSAGTLKSTYGTGCFVLMNTGDTAPVSANKLLTTIAYRLDGKVSYALEGSIFNAGTTVQWLRDGLNIIDDARETEALAKSVRSNRGLYLVPAFTGLGAPYWNPDVRGMLYGITRDTGRAELVRAALESIAYQTHDLFVAMEEDGVKPETLRVDGGMVANNWLLQFLADILNIRVDRPAVMETTALGAAYLAGVQAGIYANLGALTTMWKLNLSCIPTMQNDGRQKLLREWKKAVSKALH